MRPPWVAGGPGAARAALDSEAATQSILEVIHDINQAAIGTQNDAPDVHMNEILTRVGVSFPAQHTALAEPFSSSACLANMPSSLPAEKVRKKGLKFKLSEMVKVFYSGKELRMINLLQFKKYVQILCFILFMQKYNYGQRLQGCQPKLSPCDHLPNWRRLTAHFAGEDIYGGSDRLLSQVVPRKVIVVNLAAMVGRGEMLDPASQRKNRLHLLLKHSNFECSSEVTHPTAKRERKEGLTVKILEVSMNSVGFDDYSHDISAYHNTVENHLYRNGSIHYHRSVATYRAIKMKFLLVMLSGYFYRWR
ncbi:hypothetical protein KSP40_PGU002157 [Platanthera guangdongensis]|uniref:Uncharacterized protein n=1 Tax=Platanthera guangdongensis TaxID=2320717 RepID=A0ABR2LY10_9ASPA